MADGVAGEQALENPKVTMRRALAAAVCLVASVTCTAVARAADTAVLRLATTTSTADTGLLGAILPTFEKLCGCRVDVIAVGTGQALELGRRGDADVVLVHAYEQEMQFLAERHSRERLDVMYNDFVLVGPAADPVKIAGKKTVVSALAALAAAQAPFTSRGDKSGTHATEQAFWEQAGIKPAGAWYRSVGQGMGETLIVANEQGAYTLSDRGTWLSMSARVPNLRLLLGGRSMADNPDPTLRNRYGVMAVSPDTHPGVNYTAAQKFVQWVTSADTQRVIGDFGVKTFGQPLYYPDSEAWRRAGGR
jgi:tungstate transport system substrate-binding protein